MNLATEILGGVVVAFIGFNIGSAVEYYKKYNLYDLEKDKTTALIATLHNAVMNLLYHVTSSFGSSNTTPKSNG